MSKGSSTSMMDNFDNFPMLPAPKAKKPMKRLTCRKCEGHGIISILKGHASLCQFNDCQCETCKTVMSLRANALIRRFRHRQPGQNHAILRTIRSKNGNTRLRILPKAATTDDGTGTTIVYPDDDQPLISPPLLSSGNTSPSSISMSVSPVPSPDIKVFECLQQILANQMVSQLLQPLLPQPSISQLLIPFLSTDLLLPSMSI